MDDARALPALTLPDQLFVNALAAALVPAHLDIKDRDLWRDIARDVRPEVTRNHRFVSPMINSFAAWDAALDAARSPGADLFAPEAARWRLQDELAAFFRWRASAVHDRLYPQEHAHAG